VDRAAGRADQECQIVDVSVKVAKVIAEIPSLVPSRFELAMVQGDTKRRICDVIRRVGRWSAFCLPTEAALEQRKRKTAGH
jgi:hypothetical protein